MKKLMKIEVKQLQTEGGVANLIKELYNTLNTYGTSGVLTYEVETVTAYDDSWTEFTIYLNREETDAEYSQRLDVEKVREKIQEEREKKEFERLKAKFGNS